MALLNRFIKLNDRTETGIFTFIVTKSVTRDLHRDATTKDFCFGYHRWAVSFQRPTERTLGVHLVLRNPSASTSCLVDFTLTILNRRHMSLNEVYSKTQARFSVTNPMQGVARWIQISDLSERHFSNETGEFLFELALSNMTTIYECGLQLSANQVSQYRSMLDKGSGELLSLETNNFTFGAFEWSLAVVPLTLAANSAPSTDPSISSQQQQVTTAKTPTAPLEPVCRIYLNRLNGLECLCRVKYRVILGHHQQQPCQGAASNQQQSGRASTTANFADSKLLDQMSDSNGRIRGHQFRHTNLLELSTSRTSSGTGSSATPTSASIFPQHQQQGSQQQSGSLAASRLAATGGTSQASLELRVHIEMFCANTVSECLVPLQRSPSEPQLSNCSDRNKQAWCVECDAEQEQVRLKLFFMDLKSIPRNHIRFISWCAYLVRRDPKSGQVRDSIQVLNAPHSNYYLQDSIDLGIIMETDLPAKQLNSSTCPYLCEPNQLLVHIEWVDSLLLFSHLYTNYDALANVQRHQIGRELGALKLDLEALERKYGQCKRQLNQLLSRGFVRELDSGHSSAGSPPPASSSSTDLQHHQHHNHQHQSLPPQGSSMSPLATRATSRRGTQVSGADEFPPTFKLHQPVNNHNHHHHAAGTAPQHQQQQQHLLDQGADCWSSEESCFNSMGKQLNSLAIQPPSSDKDQHLKLDPSPKPQAGYLHHQQHLRRLPQQPYEARRNSAAPRVMERGPPTSDQLIMQPDQAVHEGLRQHQQHQFMEVPQRIYREYAAPPTNSELQPSGRAILHQLHHYQRQQHQLASALGQVEVGGELELQYNMSYHLGVSQPTLQHQHNQPATSNNLECHRNTTTYLLDNHQHSNSANSTPQHHSYQHQQQTRGRHHSLYPIKTDPLRSLSPNPYTPTGQPQPPSLSFNDDDKYHLNQNWY